MRIVHKVEPTELEISTLFELVSKPCLATYITPQEQAINVEKSKIDFETELTRLINTAMSYGLHLGLANANEMDTSMYLSKE